MTTAVPISTWKPAAWATCPAGTARRRRSSRPSTAAGPAAPGQITVDEMVDRYALHLVDEGTRVYLHVVSADRQYTDVLSAQDQAVPGAELHVPLRATAAEAGLVAGTLAAGTPAGVTVEVR
jgi:hypothetical protein